MKMNSSIIRRIVLGGVVGTGLYFGPFLPNPILWPNAVLNVFPHRNHKHRQKLTLGPEEVSQNAEMPVSKVSIIIPVYNEGAINFGKSLERLDISTHGKSLAEVVIVDAGCSDDTMAALDSVDLKIPLKVTKSSSGRGQALSAGAERATGDILLFLHADTVLPYGYDDTLRQNLADKSVLMSAFSFEINKENLNEDGSNSSFVNSLKRLEFFTNIRARYLWLPYGDQALAMRKSAYKSIGGVRNIKMMEDFEMVSRVRRIALASGGRIEILPDKAKCSARRWEKNGIVRNSILNWTFVAAYVWGGISPDKIFEYYYR